MLTLTGYIILIYAFYLLESSYLCMTPPMYPCSVYQCSCSYCSETCEAPAVNADIAFFAGFNFKTVGWSYFALILFTIIFQVASHYWCRRKPPTLISQTASTAAATRDNSSQLVAPYGGRLNNTVETSMTSNRDSALLRGVEIRN